MTVKTIIFQKGLKQLKIAKDLRIDPSRLNKFINGWQALPERHHQKLADYLGITAERLTRMAQNDQTLK